MRAAVKSYAGGQLDRSNALRPKTGPKVTWDIYGNAATVDLATDTYNNRGRLKTLNNDSTTEPLIYNALGQMVQTSGGAAGTVLYMYDEAGHLLGEYTSTGGLIQETVWLGDVPVATLRPSGSSVAVYYIEADHLGTLCGSLRAVASPKCAVLGCQKRKREVRQ